VHEVHRQVQPLITGTTGTVTRGDLRAGAGDNSFWVANGGDFGGELAAVVAGVMITVTGNEEKRTRELGDLRGTTTRAPWLSAICSKTRLRAA
jgi:hypothetical protein